MHKVCGACEEECWLLRIIQYGKRTFGENWKPSLEGDVLEGFLCTSWDVCCVCFLGIIFETVWCVSNFNVGVFCIHSSLDRISRVSQWCGDVQYGRARGNIPAITRHRPSEEKYFGIVTNLSLPGVSSCEWWPKEKGLMPRCRALGFSIALLTLHNKLGPWQSRRAVE